ncbi:MAG: lipoprotein [Burkholderiales bacterium]
MDDGWTRDTLVCYWIIPMRHVCITLAVIILLAACGQKAALYLPDDAEQKKKPVARKNEEGVVEK